MTDGHDGLNAWLSEPVQPLPPPPGTFERIRRQARRRKRRRAMLSAAGAALVVAAAVAVPQLVGSQFRPSQQVADNQRSVLQPHRHVNKPTLGPPSPASVSPTPVPSTSAPPPVPPNFAPTSVTFVGTATGWTLGQAGTPGQCGPPKAYVCTSVARTDDGGRTWRGVPAPVAGSPHGGTGVSQLRFLDTGNGWAFGPELWATHDGGTHWARIPTGGMRVTSLETMGDRVFAVWARCTGTGADFAANCTDFALYSSPAAGDAWAPVPGTDASFTLSGTASAAGLVLTQSSAYLLTPSGVLMRGATLGGKPWRPVTSSSPPQPLPCSPGAAQPDGQPSGAMLAATGPGLALLCAASPAGQSQPKKLYYSVDGGRTWRLAGSPPRAGTAASLSGTPDGPVVVATSQGLVVSADGGATWRAATVAAAPPGGFSYVGMTTSLQGIAVPADPAQHALWFTYDGGSTWTRSPLG
jgi:hypothetical protein